MKIMKGNSGLTVKASFDELFDEGVSNLFISTKDMQKISSYLASKSIKIAKYLLENRTVDGIVKQSNTDTDFYISFSSR